MLFLFLLALVNGEYQKGKSYSHSTRDSAQGECKALGADYDLCSREQLYTVVYSTTASFADPGICWTGWLSNARGWYNAGNNGCGSGWMTWDPPSGKYGAHCCTSAVSETTPATCDGNCGSGKIPVDDYSSIYCPDGTCTEELCCKAWEKAAAYQAYPGRWSYDYSTGEDAANACKAANEDWDLCTADQLVGHAEAGNLVCASGFYRSSDGFTVGWYTSEATKAQCSGSGWQDWQDASGKAAAHCCTKTYTKSDYGVLASNDEAGAQAWCSATAYTKNVCTIGQLQTISNVEDQNICKSGFYKETKASTEFSIGWYQGNEVCDGRTGLRTWASPTPAVHCCADNVPEPDLGEWRAGDSYGKGFSSGDLAQAACKKAGYDDLCTKGQVATIGSEDKYKTDLCVVGWAQLDGGFVAGYWQTTATVGPCGKRDAWNDEWIPATPVEFCCMSSVPEKTLTQKAYKNGDWDYSYANKDEAAAQCTGDYSLCSKAQLFTIATVGVELTDGSTQKETSICRLGWTSDSGAGWWQGDDSTGCGATGWRTFSSEKAGYHCCLAFQAEELGTTSTAPATTELTLEAFRKASPSYDFFTEEEAKSACKALHSGYSLCSAAQLVQVAVLGAPGDATFSAVDTQVNMCFSSWVDSSKNTCNPAHQFGWYQVESKCGSAGFSWEGYAPETNGKRHAGAFCCADTVVPTGDYKDELGCAPETSVPPTVAPAVKEYFELPDSVCEKLGRDCANLYTKDGAYYYSDGTKPSKFYQPTRTCVAYGAPDASCDNTENVCSGVLRNTYGTYESQGAMLTQAIAETNHLHSRCPPPSCTDYQGYAPVDFEDKVKYCVYNGCYFLNGMETCVCDGDISKRLEDLWTTSFELSECPNPRSFDEIMDDQLWITDTMITNLEEQVQTIPDVNNQLTTAKAELTGIWNNWESEITKTIEAAITTANKNSDVEVAGKLNDILDSFKNLNTGN